MLPQLALLAAVASTVLAAAVPQQRTASCPDYCKGTKFADAQYVCGDWRLGPVDLPTLLPINVTTIGYDRFGGLCPGAFLFTWFNESGNTSSYIYPPQDGFLTTTSDAPVKGTVTLAPGTLLDRFGSEFGAFLAPYGSPYEQRALPPSNLATNPNAPEFPNNYHVYEVMRPLDAVAGPITPWFGQPGLGTQFQTMGGKSVGALVAEGVLRRVALGELVDGYGRPL